MVEKWSWLEFEGKGFMYRIPQIVSAKIANLSVICCFLVVAIHLPHIGERGTIVWYLDRFCGREFAKMAVPSFFFISGFLVSWYVRANETYVGFIKKRFQRLVIPYFAWLSLALVVRFLWMVVAKYRGVCTGNLFDMSPWEYWGGILQRCLA